MIRTLLKPLSFLPALLLMYTIYTFSAQPADVSSQLSFKVSCKIVEAADYIFDANLEQWEVEQWATKIHFITRKLAHMTIYFALAVAVAFPLYVYGVRGIWLMLLAGLICVGFACGDEYHQSFVEGRSPAKKDVAIDAFGVFWGIILVRIVGWSGRKTIFRPRKEKVKKTKKVKNMKGQPQQMYQNAGFPPPPQGYPQSPQSYPQNPQGYYQNRYYTDSPNNIPNNDRPIQQQEYQRYQYQQPYFQQMPPTNGQQSSYSGERPVGEHSMASTNSREDNGYYPYRNAYQPPHNS